jgi:hypothetical protein
MAEAGDKYSELQGVMVRGRCEIIEGEDAVRAALQLPLNGQTGGGS